MNSYSFPSVYERHNSELDTVSNNLINGLKLYLNGEAYIIGNLALSEGLSPHKIINSSPEDLDYNLFLYSGLLLANEKSKNKKRISTGFPFSTYKVNREIAKTIIRGKHIVDYDASTYSKNSKTKDEIEVIDVEIIPEMIANITALRDGELKAKGDFFVVSLGYGTFEAVFSTESGIVQRTAVSTQGIHYAINMFMKELEETHYLGLKNRRQIDATFQEDYIVLNRKKHDIRKLKETVLKSYYNDIISPALMNAFSDSDFSKAKKLYITGGGSLYPDLFKCFMDEFSDVVSTEIVTNPLTLASQGYFLNSLKGIKNGEIAVGLDIGNSNTVLTLSGNNFYSKDTL